MSGDYEDLSRLLDGDLEPAEADALRKRIADEPGLAAAWARMCALPADLADLPDEVPPPGLDDRVLGRVRARTRWPLWIAPAALAAAAVLWVGLRPETGRIVLVDGEQWVEGRADVMAGAIPVHVDGLARIVVEPAAGVVRGRGGEEATMKTVLSGAAGALAGAAVTVAVMRGEATMTPVDGEPIVVMAGDSTTLTPPGAPPVAVAPRPQLAAGATPAQRIAFLEREVTDLRAQLAEAEFTGAVAKGQLLKEQGEPLAWPAEYPDPMRPEAFEATIREKAASLTGVAVHAVDCSEYPCIATLTATETTEGWQDPLRTLPHLISPDEQKETGVWMSIALSEDGDEQSGIVGIALVPEGADDAVNERTNWRAEALMQDAEPAEEPEDAEAPAKP